ncbi:MAG TPA: RDD family protein, partial [Steroidobacteraceae bacterium]
MNTTNPYAPPQAAVQDVTDSGEHVLAGRGARLGAALLDGLIVVVVMYLPLIVAVKASGNPLFVHARFNTAGISEILFLLPVAGLLAIGWLNYLYVSRNGQSIAKKIIGIKVVRSDGSPVSV